jgi:integrase
MKRTGKHEVNADEPTPLVNIDKPWFRVRERAKLPDVRLHDLRRTVGSHLAMSGVPLLVIGKALNQTTAQTTMVYARLSQDPVREALERHARNLLASAGDPDIGEAASPDASKTASVHAIGKAHGGKRKQA